VEGPSAAGVEKKTVEEARALLHSDECGVYLLPFVRSTWARKGHPPVLREQCGYEHMSVIAAISSSGNLVYDLREGTYDGDGVGCFLKTLTYHYRKQRMVMVWDGAAIHRCRQVKEFLASSAGKIHLEYFPAYSPEFNATELLWGWLKGRLANRIFTTLSELRAGIVEELESAKNNRSLIRSFFRKPELCLFL